MSPIHVADSVRIALGTDSDCQALADALGQTALPTQMCDSIQGLIDFRPAAVVLDAQLARSLSISALREALPHVVLIARSEITRVAQVRELSFRRQTIQAKISSAASADHTNSGLPPPR